MILGLFLDKKINIIDTLCFFFFLGLFFDEEDESCFSSECESRESSVGSIWGIRRFLFIFRFFYIFKIRRVEGRFKRFLYVLFFFSLDIFNGYCKC